MRFQNEVLVGAAVVLAVAIAVFGIRFLEGRPLFGGGFGLVGVFEDAQGLTAGSQVRVAGVRVGTVEAVRLGPDARGVLVEMALDPGVEIPRGATLGTGGLSALGDVNVAITPGPARNAPLADGDTVYAGPGGDLLGLLQENGGRLVGAADTLVTSAAGTFATVDGLLADTEGDLRQTLAALRGAATSADALLRSERGRLRATLASLEAASASAAELSDAASRFAADNGDSLAATVAQLNRTLARVDASLDGLDQTTAGLDDVLAKLNGGEGTLGLLLTEPGLYRDAEAALANLNALLADFQENPRRYLQELRLVDVF